MRNIVDRLDLRRALADENTVAKLKVAGFRGQNPLTKFLFFRLDAALRRLIALGSSTLPAGRACPSSRPS
jgi:pilus assembly protein TadC